MAQIQGGRLALGPFRLSKLGMAPLLAPVFGRNGHLWEVRGIEISMREPDFEPLSWFEPSCLGVKKNQSVSIRKTI